jgi:hypothetical protein
MHARILASGVAPVITALGSNAVPIVGYVWAEWSTATTMVVYFVECLLLIGLTVVRVWWMTKPDSVFSGSDLQVRGKVAVRTPGMTRADSVTAGNVPQSRRRFLESFLLLGGGFLGVSGVFAAVVIFLMVGIPVDWDAALLGLGIIVVMQLAGLVTDRLVLGQVSPIYAEAWAMQSLGRIFLFYLGVFAGVVGAVLGGWSFLAPFMALKTMTDVGGVVQQVGRLRRAPTLPLPTSPQG